MVKLRVFPELEGAITEELTITVIVIKAVVEELLEPVIQLIFYHHQIS
jgi:hypothetical protein